MASHPQRRQFSWDDPLSLDGQITEDERAVRDTAYAYCQEQLLPQVLHAFRHEETDVGVFRSMGELGLLGATIPETYGGAGLNYVCYGLIAREVERVDSGYRSMMSVQSSLVMVPIHEFGNEATRQKYLPKLATGEWIGCFGLTEPNHGSDPGSMITRVRKVDGGYRLSGAKMWITNRHRSARACARRFGSHRVRALARLSVDLIPGAIRGTARLRRSPVASPGSRLA